MENQKPLQFTSSVSAFFVVYLVCIVACFVPLFGIPFAFNYSSTWLADNLLVNGKKVRYQATYVETLKFIFINLLLTCITFGIYSFWFTVKSYRYMCDHIDYADAQGAAPAAAIPPQPVQASAPPAAPLVQPTTVQPQAPTPPQPPTLPPSPIQ
jgi:uncharacterized membrane protein YjgN (DUF898 family)